MTDDLLTLLDDVHRALVSGGFDDIAQLQPRIDLAAQELGPVSKTDAALIRSKCERNASCLAAALEGLGSARRRIAEIRRAAGGMTTYNKSGAASVIVTNPLRFRRA